MYGPMNHAVLGLEPFRTIILCIRPIERDFTMLLPVIPIKQSVNPDNQMIFYFVRLCLMGGLFLP